MAPPVPSPFLKLFGVDRTGPGHSLQHIRDKIYSYAWSRIRRDDFKLDFVISETGINRNVPERLVSGEDPYDATKAPRVPPPPCNLHLINKQVSKDFTRYIYSVNDLEVDVDLKPLDTNEGQAALAKIATFLCNANFKKYTRTVRVRIHFPAEYSAANLPDFNQSALDSIASALDAFQRLGHLAIRMVPGQGSPLDYELRLAAFPFYPMRMTNWSIRVLNTTTFPYTWNLVDAQQVVLLNQAYDTYCQTGSLTAPTLPTKTEPAIPNQRVSHKGVRQSSNNFRQPTNGSQKRRGRKRRAVETAVAIHEATANIDVANQATTFGNVHSPDPKATTTRPTVIGAEEQSLGSQGDYTHPTSGRTGANEQSLDREDWLNRVSCTEHSRPTSAPSPPLSPAQEKEETHIPDLMGPLVPTPTKSSDGKPANYTFVSDPAKDKTQQNSGTSSPAPSSVTLGPVNEEVTVGNVDDVIAAAADVDGNIVQLLQQKKKRRNKKRKNKTKSKAFQPTGIGSREALEIEVKVQMIDQEHPEPSNDLAVRHEEASVEPSLSDSNRFDLAQGTWSTLGETYALFTPTDGSISSLHSRTPRVERYMRQQERLLAARAETEDRQKQVKAKQQARKARKLLLRRDHIAADSPLLRATERPRDKATKEVKSHARSSSPKPDKDVARDCIRKLCQMEDEKRKIERKMRKIQYSYDIEKLHNRQCIDDDEPDLDDQPNSGSSTQDHRFKFFDNESIDSPIPEKPESIVTEDSGEEPNEASCMKSNRRTHSNGFSIELQKENSELYRRGSLGPQTNEDGQHSANNDSLGTSEDSVEFSEGNALRNIYPEYGRSQQPVSQCYDMDNEFISPVLPVPLRMPSNEFASQRALEISQGLPESDECPPEDHYHSRRGSQRGRRSRRAWGQFTDRGNCAPVRDNYRGNYSGGRTPNISPRVERAENLWATAVQAGDREFVAQSVQRRIALEQDMQAKGTTYTDYATPIEDSYIRLDEERKRIDEENKKIVYGPQSEVLSPLEGPVLVQEATGVSVAKTQETQDANSL